MKTPIKTMDAKRGPSLSKSRFTAGLQCLKRLYLECYHRELADAVDDSTQARFDAGNAVGELARERFPGGRLVAESHLEHEAAVATTQQLLESGPAQPLYEAAFDFAGIRVRADILRPSGGGGFDLVEVKSTTKFDAAKHLSDVAIQLYALEGAGLRINRACLLHLNNQYVYPGGAYDLEQLFSLHDATAAARRFAAGNAPAELARMWAALRRDAAPDIAPGRHCQKPYRCPFYGHCHRAESEPPDYAAQPYISPNLASNLGRLRYPVSFLDFETLGPALPVYAGTRPYQAIPFQWSLHIQDAAGGLSHREFLNNDAADPRERVIVSLLEAAAPQGSIVVYSSFEKTRLTRLAEEFPQYAGPLTALRERLFDLLPIIRRDYRHSALPNNSLKTVLPALVPDWGFDDLEIQAGDVAAIAYARLIDTATPEAEKAQIRQDLRAYCKRDTEATFRVLAALRALAGR